MDASIDKHITVHCLRHANTAHRMELGMEMLLVQGFVRPQEHQHHSQQWLYHKSAEGAKD